MVFKDRSFSATVKTSAVFGSSHQTRRVYTGVYILPKVCYLQVVESYFGIHVLPRLCNITMVSYEAVEDNVDAGPI